MAAQLRVTQRTHDLHASVKVAQHPIGAADVHLFITVVGKIIDATVLEESSYDAAHANVFRQARHPRPQHADTAHNQIDGHTGGRGFVQLFDNNRISQPVKLDHDASLASGICVFSFAFDKLR